MRNWKITLFVILHCIIHAFNVDDETPFRVEVDDGIHHITTTYMDSKDIPPTVHFLDLGNNNIQSIEPGALCSFSNLHTVILSGNNITLLDSNTFSCLTKLKKLYLNGNPHLHVPDKQHSIMSNSLRYLDIRHTNISSALTREQLPNLYIMWVSMMTSNNTFIDKELKGTTILDDILNKDIATNTTNNHFTLTTEHSIYETKYFTSDWTDDIGQTTIHPSSDNTGKMTIVVTVTCSLLFLLVLFIFGCFIYKRRRKIETNYANVPTVEASVNFPL